MPKYILKDSTGQIWNDIDDNNISEFMEQYPEAEIIETIDDVIEVEDDIIQDACFKTFGCGSAIASSSLVTEWIKGKSLDEANEIKNTHIAKELALPPVKIHCSVLAEDAIKAAIMDYKNKHTK